MNEIFLKNTSWRQKKAPIVDSENACLIFCCGSGLHRDGPCLGRHCFAGEADNWPTRIFFPEAAGTLWPGFYYL
jgi:hypothetical protein